MHTQASAACMHTQATLSKRQTQWQTYIYIHALTSIKQRLCLINVEWKLALLVAQAVIAHQYFLHPQIPLLDLKPNKSQYDFLTKCFFHWICYPKQQQQNTVISLQPSPHFCEMRRATAFHSNRNYNFHISFRFSMTVTTFQCQWNWHSNEPDVAKVQNQMV